MGHSVHYRYRHLCPRMNPPGQPDVEMMDDYMEKPDQPPVCTVCGAVSRLLRHDRPSEES